MGKWVARVAPAAGWCNGLEIRQSRRSGYGLPVCGDSGILAGFSEPYEVAACRRACWVACSAARPGQVVPAITSLRSRVLPIMEINPILNSIKDLSERTQTIRGYL